jgi:Holliday junction resolvase RusA-like endonuclease
MEEEKHIKSPIIFNNSLENVSNAIYSNVPGNPFAKQRPRAARKGRFITIYTPNETKAYESKVRKYYNSIYNGILVDGSLTVEIEGIFSVPSNASKKKASEMLSGDIPHTKKPDCDNMAKICLDALNGVAYTDDAIINRLNVSKRYGTEPMVRILIYENN